MLNSILACLVVFALSGCARSSDRNRDAGSAGTAGASGTGGTGGHAGGGGGARCSPACGEARDCCGSQCVNLQNDRRNCGRCAETCSADKYCNAGHCETPACSAVCERGTVCCGSACCGPETLCCDPQGPIDMGPHCIAPTESGTCPAGCAPLCICASPDTPIATPTGNRAIASLAAGDAVYSIDHGVLSIVPIIRTQRTPISNHHVMQVVLQGGAVLQISPGHPTADGRYFRDLRVGDALDGVLITTAELIPYVYDATYDILPDSDTASYFGAGVLIGSTLAPTPLRVDNPSAAYESNKGDGSAVSISPR